jgi:glycosyltransferase involved in cell wall biosynthesis
MPKVSVVIPTHNRASFLRAAINSVLNQTFQDFEILIVDDASKDQTPELIRSFMDPRIKYIRHHTNKGQGVTRNDGIRRTSGEFIALLDDDDEWLPHKLEKQVRLLESSPSDVGLIYTGLYTMDASNKQVLNVVSPEQRGYALEQLWLRNFIGTCSSVLIRRIVFDKVELFDEKLAAKADYDLWIRIAEEFAIDYIREPLVLFRTLHENRISTNCASVIQGMEAQLAKHGRSFARNNRCYGYYHFILGLNYCLAGNLTVGRRAFVRAIRLYPFSIRPYYYLFLSLIGMDTVRKWKELRQTRGLLHSNLFTLSNASRERAWKKEDNRIT